MSERETISKKGLNHIATDVVFDGTIHFDDYLIVSGLVLGNIVGKKGDLEITSKGEAFGKHEIQSLQNRGKIAGQTKAERVHLFTSSISCSDFDIAEIVVDKKAIVNGKIQMPVSPLS